MATTKKKKKPEPVIEVVLDTKTSNKSFIKMHKELKKEGIENNGFILSLFDPSLIGKDPYYERLNYDDVRHISNECEANMWYYLRECLMVRKNIGDGSMDNFKLTKQIMAAFWCVKNNYSIMLNMDRKEAMQIAHSIMLYFHQCGTRKHFEVVSKNDESQYELSEYSAYYLFAPMYVYSQNNIEPIYYETEEVLYNEMKYQHTAAMLYLDEFFTLENIKGSFTKWQGCARKPVLIMTRDPKNDNKLSKDGKDLYTEIEKKYSIEWDNSFLDDQRPLQPYKKKGVVIIKK